MKLWAIKDFNSGKYYDFRSHSMEDINPHTEFFISKEDAWRAINGMSLNGDSDHKIYELRNELAWNYLERKYKMPAWKIEVDKEELELIKAMFRLSPVEIEVSE